MEDLEGMENMVKVMKDTHPDMVREARQVDRRALTSWSDSSKAVLLIGDGTVCSPRLISFDGEMVVVS